MKKKVIYIPLDERHCNYGYPFELGQSAKQNVLRPPIDLMCKIKEPADVDAMWNWLFENIRGCNYAILSLDMLVYGGLLPSRLHHHSNKILSERLNRLKRLKEINPKVEIHAFMLIMRVANYNNNSEEPNYWEQHGKNIWRYSWLYEKKEKCGLDNNEEKDLRDLVKIIPPNFLNDFMLRREKNLEINIETLHLVEDAYIDYLVLPKDDSAEYGFSTRDQTIVSKKVSEMKKLSGRVYVYPGTDEVGSTLVARVVNKIHNAKPNVFVCYSSTLGPSIIALYEDRPIHESVKWQIVSAGCAIVDNYNDADFVLMVNTPGTKMGEAQDQKNDDYSYINFRNLEEFVQRMEYFIGRGKICTVADIAYANGADNGLMEILARKRLLKKIAAYGGWNTTANTLGVVICQGVIASALHCKNISSNKELFSFHIQKILKDWVCQSNVLLYFDFIRSKELGFYPNKLGEYADQVKREMIDKMNGFISEHNLRDATGVTISVDDITFVWNRIYDYEFSIHIGDRQ